MIFCMCGCGQEVKKGRKWKVGHYIRVNNPSKSSEVREILSQKRKGRAPWNKGKIGLYSVAAMKGKLSGDKNPAKRPEIKAKISKSLRESEKFKKIRETQSGENNPNWGNHLSDEARKRISEANRNLSDETRRKMSEAKKGKNLSDEHRRRLSLVRKGRPKSEEWKRKIGERNKGRIRSEEVKRRISKANKGRLVGDKNPSKRPEVKEKLSGDNNPNWRGGVSFKPYCHKFNNKLKEHIRERDNRKCQRCGKSEKEDIKKLIIHHIHYDKENCYPDLISLCNKCHTKANFNRDCWEEYFMKILERRGLLNYFDNKKVID